MSFSQNKGRLEQMELQLPAANQTQPRHPQLPSPPTPITAETTPTNIYLHYNYDFHEALPGRITQESSDCKAFNQSSQRRQLKQREDLLEGNPTSKRAFEILKPCFWFLIFVHLDFREVSRLASVCHDFKRITSSENLWRHKFIARYVPHIYHGIMSEEWVRLLDASRQNITNTPSMNINNLNIKQQEQQQQQQEQQQEQQEQQQQHHHHHEYQHKIDSYYYQKGCEQDSTEKKELLITSNLCQKRDTDIKGEVDTIGDNLQKVNNIYCTPIRSNKNDGDLNLNWITQRRVTKRSPKSPYYVYSVHQVSNGDDYEEFVKKKQDVGMSPYHCVVQPRNKYFKYGYQCQYQFYSANVKYVNITRIADHISVLNLFNHSFPFKGFQYMKNWRNNWFPSICDHHITQIMSCFDATSMKKMYLQKKRELTMHNVKEKKSTYFGNESDDNSDDDEGENRNDDCEVKQPKEDQSNKCKKEKQDGDNFAKQWFQMESMEEVTGCGKFENEVEETNLINLAIAIEWLDSMCFIQINAKEMIAYSVLTKTQYPARIAFSLLKDFRSCVRASLAIPQRSIGRRDMLFTGGHCDLNGEALLKKWVIDIFNCYDTNDFHSLKGKKSNNVPSFKRFSFGCVQNK